MMTNPLRIDAKSLTYALARRLCKAFTFIAGVPIVCQIFARKGFKGRL